MLLSEPLMSNVWVQVKTEDVSSLARYGFDQANLSAISKHLQNLDDLARAIQADEPNKIYDTSINALHKICEGLHKRAMVEMATRVQEKGIVLIDEFKKIWFSKVDKYETATQFSRKSGKDLVKRQLQEYPEYLRLWQTYFHSKTHDQVHITKSSLF